MSVKIKESLHTPSLKDHIWLQYIDSMLVFLSSFFRRNKLLKLHLSKLNPMLEAHNENVKLIAKNAYRD